ncbi:MAG: protein-tyrosine phosphatase family protein [Planctomycetota bacterium]|jgi:protein-tyrosine phosphatase
MVWQQVFWVENETQGRLGVMPCPNGGAFLEQEILAMREDGLDVLVSLLTESETNDFGLAEEAGICARFGVEFLSHPVADGEVPASVDDVWEMVERLAQDMKEGRSVVVHCFAGIGRSVTIAGCILVAAGMEVEDVLDSLSEARGFPVPETEEQREWIAQYARARKA